MARPKMTAEEKAEAKERREAEKLLGAAAKDLATKAGVNPKKNPGVFELKRVGSYGMAFANFETGKRFWIQFSKSTDRKEIIDVFEPHFEQYVWKLGEMDTNRRIPVWVYLPKDENGKDIKLQYLDRKTVTVHEIKDIERVKDEKRSVGQGREFFDFYVITSEKNKIHVRPGEGLFGQLHENCIFENCQDLAADALTALWPGRVPLMKFGQDSGFGKLTMKPVAIQEISENKVTSSPDPEGIKTVGIESGKLDRPIIGITA